MTSDSSEKSRLRDFALAVFEHLVTQDGSSESDFASEHREVLRSPGWTLAQARMAASDIIEMAQDIRGDWLSNLDAALEASGLPTLSAMRNTQYRKLLRILTTGKIGSESEHRLVIAALANLDSGELSNSERIQLEAVLGSHAAQSVV